MWRRHKSALVHMVKLRASLRFIISRFPTAVGIVFWFLPAGRRRIVRRSRHLAALAEAYRKRFARERASLHRKKVSFFLPIFGRREWESE